MAHMSPTTPFKRLIVFRDEGFGVGALVQRSV